MHRTKTLVTRSLIVAAAGAVVAAGAAGQSGSSSIVMVSDDGSAPNIMHFSLPDVHALRQPDYVRDDLPAFRRILALDDAQHAAVAARLDAYLEAFETLMREGLGDLPSMPAFEIAHFGEGEQGADEGEMGAGIGDLIRRHMEGAEGQDVEMDFSAAGGVMVAITAGAGGPMGPAGGSGGDGADEEVATWVATSENEGDGAGGAGGGPPAAGVVVTIGAEGVEIPEALREELEKKAEEMAAKLRERMEDAEARGAGPFGEGFDPAARIEEHRARMEELAARVEQLEAKKDGLRLRFEIDAQSELTAGQFERWPILDRALTRRKTLPQGRLDGERTDLIAIIDDMEIEPAADPHTAEQVLGYELTLHEALRRRNEFIPKAQRDVDAALEARDFDKALSTVERAARLRIAVRDVNEVYGEAIARTLDEPVAAAFRDRVSLASYPRVYRPGVGLRAFEQARGLPGLAEEMLLRILELETSYRAELDLANAEIRRTIDAWQPLEPQRPIEHMRAALEGEDPGPGAMMNMTNMTELHQDDPVHAAFRKRRDLDERSMKLLYEILPPEMVADLPALPSARRAPGFRILRSAGAE